MHVCLFSSGFDPMLPKRMGAIEQYVYGLSKELSHHCSVDVFGYGAGSQEVGSLRIHAFNLNVYFSSVLKRVFRHKQVFATFYNMHVLKEVLSLHKEDSIDILHINAIYSGPLATICKSIFDIPVVCSVHNEIKVTWPIKSCNKIFAVSNYIKNYLSKKKKIDPSKIEVVHNAIDADFFRPVMNKESAKKEIGLQDYNVVLFVGRKEKRKGPQVIIRSLPKILKQFPKTVLILIGPDFYFGSTSIAYTKYLCDIAKNLNVRDQVFFKDFIPREVLLKYYSAADIFVCPSIWPDPCPSTVMEALALKKAVIASKVGGIPDIISDRINGILVSPDDSEALADAAISLIDSEEIAKFYGENGRKTVLEKFCFKSISKQCLQIYEKLISK